MYVKKKTLCLFSTRMKDEVIRDLNKLIKHKQELAISNIVVFTDNPSIEEQTVSEDETIIIIPFQVSLENQEIEESREKIYKTVADIDVDYYLTGERYYLARHYYKSRRRVKKDGENYDRFILNHFVSRFSVAYCPIQPFTYSWN